MSVFSKQMQRFFFASLALLAASPSNFGFFVGVVAEAEDDTAEDAELDEPERPSNWNDSPLLTELWKLVSKESGQTDEQLEVFLAANPMVSSARSTDGRGGLYWAFEYKNAHALAALKAFGAPDPMTQDADMKEKGGKLPSELCDAEGCAAELLKGVDEKVTTILEAKKKRDVEAARELDDDDDEIAPSGGASAATKDVDDEDDL